MRELLEKKEHLHFRQDNVVDILTDENKKKIVGVVTQTGQKIFAKTEVLTSGTFLNGLIHIGESQYGGGRSGERASIGISAALEKLGFEIGRLKTGTPPRVDGRSIDYDQLEIQYGEDNATPFSFMMDELPSSERQLSCWIGYTNTKVHEMLRTGFDKSPMFNGRIKSIGPRYCPSIEDKIDRFADKDRHQLFLEPEGWNTYEMYLNGFSTSLPEETQLEALHLIPGFEKAIMLRPGYAIEYDYFPPYQINRSLETKIIDNLYFAGQINGTTGYEEAACQGLMAGINAALKVRDEDPLVLKRSEAYIGVLIDDLVNKGTEEPYRMFTSRAEHRIILRQDNADLRLTPIGRRIGLVEDERWIKYQKRAVDINQLMKFIKSYSAKPSVYNEILSNLGTTPLKQSVKLDTIIPRPQVSLTNFIEHDEELSSKVAQLTLDKTVIEQVEIQIKYAGYIQKEMDMVEEIKAKEHMIIPKGVNYDRIQSLSTEGRLKMKSGVSASDISVLMIYLKS
jgi:tRNA uridine 5-carboxymethylaminomethyl modification enzyme